MVDQKLSQTQFGFRKDKSTADAIQLIRGIMKQNHGTYNKLHLVALDWEKAFDEVDREKRFDALERMNIHPKYVNVIRSLYKKNNVQGRN